MPNNVTYGGSGRTSLKVIYKTEWGTRFKVDGDLTRTLEVEGGKGYVLDWMREKLRKMGNGQIKVVKHSSEERDWEQEEKIKRQLWEDINVNEYPEGIDFEDGLVYEVKEYKNNTIICTKPEQTVVYKRPPSPCKIS